MDNTEEFTSISLCAGYGGIELGLRRAIPNLRTVCYVERETFAIANLVAKIETGQMDAAPVWTDVRTFPSEQFHGKIRLITGGYPCQPFSSAGQRRGKDDPRHLWPYILRIVGSIKPVYCFFENVEGHITLGLNTVISDLGELGYQATWGIFSAEEVGAPHQRKRVFILADSGGEGLEGRRSRTFGTKEELTMLAGGRSNVWPSRPGEPQRKWEAPRVVDDANRWRPVNGGKNNGKAKGNDDQAWPTDQAKPSQQRQAQSPLGRTINGTSLELVQSTSRVDELQLLGNGIVPATAEKAWRVLSDRLRGTAE